MLLLLPPHRRKRVRLDTIAAQWDPFITGAQGQKRPSNGSSSGAPASKHLAAVGLDGHPVRAGGSGSKHGSKDSSRHSGGGAGKGAGGKPAASKIRLRGQGAPAKRGDAAAAAAAAARGPLPGASNSRSSGGGGSSALQQGAQQQQQFQQSGQQRPRRSSSKGGGRESLDQQQQEQASSVPLTRQQRKQQKESEMLLMDMADIDIPDDILELGDDPLFGSSNMAAGGAAVPCVWWLCWRRCASQVHMRV